MARLPTVGGDSGNWGAVLNEYLSIEHNADGTLKKAADITAAKAAADSAVQSVNGKTGQAISLNASDVSAISNTQLGSANGVATLDGTGKLTATQLPTNANQGSVEPGTYKRYGRLSKAVYASLPWLASDAERAEEIAIMQDLGVEVARINAWWSDIEGPENTFNWAALDDSVDKMTAAGIEIAISIEGAPTWVLPPGDSDTSHSPTLPNMYKFGIFCERIAQRYAGKIYAYIIWNEPNHTWLGPGNPSEYISMLEESAPLIKAADPAAIIVNGAFAFLSTDGATQATNYLATFIDAGGDQYLDAYNTHIYVPSGESAITVTGANDTVTNQDFRAIEHFAQILRNKAVDKPIWMTEFGWHTAPVTLNPSTQDPWMTGVTEAVQAVRLRGAFELLDRYSWLEHAFVFHLNDFEEGPPNTSSEMVNFFGLVAIEAGAVRRYKPAAYIFKRRLSSGMSARN